MLACKIACLKSGQWLLGCHPARKASQPEHQNTRRKPARRKPDAKTSQPDKRPRVYFAQSRKLSRHKKTRKLFSLRAR